MYTFFVTLFFDLGIIGSALNQQRKRLDLHEKKKTKIATSILIVCLQEFKNL